MQTSYLLLPITHFIERWIFQKLKNWLIPIASFVMFGTFSKRTVSSSLLNLWKSTRGKSPKRSLKIFLKPNGEIFKSITMVLDKSARLAKITECYLPLSLITLAIILFFWKFLFFGFASDDFFHLWAARFNNFNNFINFFSFGYSLNEINYTFYRPLTTHVYYGLINKFFNLNPFPYHVVSLTIHIFNTLLVYKLFKLIAQEKIPRFAYLAAIFYGFNPSHAVTIGWAGVFQEIGVTFFILLSILFFYKNLIHTKQLYFFASIGFFILALFSKEVAIILPFFLVLVVLFTDPKKNFLKTLPFFIVLIIYSYMRFIIYKFVQTEGYTFIINSQALNTLRWHIWWALGFPEIYTNFIGPKLIVNSRLWTDFLKESLIVFPLFIALNISIIFSIAAIIKKEIKQIFDRRIVLFASMYIIFLLPVIFLPQNKHAYHQTTSLAGFSIVLALVLRKFEETKIKYSNVIINIIVISFLILSYISVDLSRKHNFIFIRAKIADKLLNSFKEQYPNLVQNSIIYIKNDELSFSQVDDYKTGIQSYYALRGPFAFRLLYGDNIDVYYEGVNMPPSNTDESRLVEFVAKF